MEEPTANLGVKETNEASPARLDITTAMSSGSLALTRIAHEVIAIAESGIKRVLFWYA
jgi:hypothetical protein